jgi:hypothetical protein
MQNTSSPSAPGLRRREFLKSTALVAGAALLGAPAFVRGQNLNSKLRLAQVGAGGKGSSDTDHCSSEDIVALCDADQNSAAGQLKKYPGARYFRDYRKMFEEAAGSFDAVLVSTPDHNHACAASHAIKLGKHVYVQKPLTYSVFEARHLRDLARKQGVVTQMGNQGSAEDGLRRAVECIQAGLIGAVREIHVWSNRPIWPQGIERPTGEDPIPDNLNWDAWIGPAPMRPYKKDVYHAFKWRGWQDFGTGALGDMACHTSNMPFRACKLGYPTAIECEDHSGMNQETYPQSSRIRFEFPEREGLVPVKFMWYDGGWKPAPALTTEIAEMMGQVPGSGCMLVGDKGKIFSPDDYGARFFVRLKDDKELKEAKLHEAVTAIAQTIPRNNHQGDADRRQHLEWLAAIKAGKPNLPFSNFEIAAYLTEIILLGDIALRVGKGVKMDWDGPKMQARNCPTAAQYVKREYRSGWTL